MKPKQPPAMVRRRNKIMYAAKILFEKKGIDNVTMNEIATAAQMCRATVFNHFDGIGDLLIKLGEQEIDDIIEYCKDLTENGYPYIRAMFHKLIEDTALYPNLVTRLTNKMILSDKERNSVAIFEQTVSRQLTFCTLNESLQNVDSSCRVIMVMGLYYGLINDYHINRRVFDTEKLYAEFDAMLSSLIS